MQFADLVRSRGRSTTKPQTQAVIFLSKSNTLASRPSLHAIEYLDTFLALFLTFCIIFIMDPINTTALSSGPNSAFSEHYLVILNVLGSCGTYSNMPFNVNSSELLSEPLHNVALDATNNVKKMGGELLGRATGLVFKIHV